MDERSAGASIPGEVVVVTWVVTESEADVAADRLWALGASAVVEAPVVDAAAGGVRLVRLEADLPADAPVPSGASVRPVTDTDLPPPPEGAWYAGRIRLRTVDVPPANGAVEIVLNGRGAFGAGSHPSTRLAVEAIDRWGDPTGRRVLDVGSGTGVLAITAALLGATAVDTVEVDSEARHRTVENAMRNGVGDRVTRPVATLDELPADARYDLVVMNVLSAVHRELGRRVGERLAPGARVVLAGMLVEQVDEVLAAHPPMLLVARLVDGDWISLVAESPPA